MSLSIPPEITRISEALEAAGFEAYAVGGCVRDLLIGREPKDWDFTTNADPDQIQAIFPDSFYENEYGTVGVKTGASKKNLEIVEITPYRLEAGYSDKRRPDSVRFGTSLSEDLARRDFTINAIALNPATRELTDPYEGQKDIKDKMLRAVGNPHERLAEDALRMLRAIRLVAELEFGIDGAVATAIEENGHLLKHVSRERIRDELTKILLSNQPMEGLVLAQRLNIIDYISPNISKGIGIEQNQAHKYDVFGHLMRTMQHAADKNCDFDVRLAGLFHDIGKPDTRRWSKEKNDWTFHGHDVVGARITKKDLEDLRFSRETVERVTKLVRWHMFFSDPDKITLSAVRRVIVNVGKDNIVDLLNLRICDRIGTGRPKEQPFRFRKYKAMVDQALRDPISVGMLKINGSQIMEQFHEKPGPRIGNMLHALLEEVLDEPDKNTEEYLQKRTTELCALSDEELRTLGEEGKLKKEEAEEKEIQSILNKHKVS